MKIQIGDYVLGTKYLDGDPCDPFCVGFVKEIMQNYTPVRYDIVDAAGESFRKNGFRKVRKITKEEGKFLVDLFFEISDKEGMSLWWHLRQYRTSKKNNLI